MSPNRQAVVGIDVGGKRKGFHAVVLRNGVLEKPIHSANPADIMRWCREQNADIIAVDAPCGWSISGSSRLAERQLKLSGNKIHCFATPTRAHAVAHRKGFYGWVFNGEELYRLLKPHYPLFDGRPRQGPLCFETFPHAIVCALAGKVIPAKPKRIRRIEALREQKYDVTLLSNIDFIDAALCAVTAEKFRIGRIMRFGTRDEGII
jgi:predicted nuclease with RNAse H fold